MSGSVEAARTAPCCRWESVGSVPRTLRVFSGRSPRTWHVFGSLALRHLCPPMAG